MKEPRIIIADAVPDGATDAITPAQLTAALWPTGLNTWPHILPNCVRYVKSSGLAGQHVSVIIELAPAIWPFWMRHPDEKALRDGIILHNDDGRVTRLALPYVVMHVFYRHEPSGLCDLAEQVLIAFRNHPLESLDDELFNSVLMNVHSNWYMCLGTRMAGYSLRELVSRVISAFVNRRFSPAYGTAETWFTAKHVDERLYPVERWESESIRDPLFPLSVKWIRAGGGRPLTTLADVIDHHHRWEDTPTTVAHLQRIVFNHRPNL